MAVKTSAIVILVLSSALVASADELDSQAVEKSIGRGLTDQLGVSVQSVSCPAGRPMKAGDVFSCTARVEDVGRLTVAVTQTDDEGNIHWEVSKTEGLLDLRSLESDIRKGLEAKGGGATVRVSCGRRFHGIRVGDAFDCKAEDSDGEKITVQVTMQDDQGNVHWKVTASEAPQRAAVREGRPDAHGLIEFEKAVRWSEVSKDWAKRHPGWLQEVGRADTAAEVGKLAVELEAAMGWPSVQDSWRQERAAWVETMANAPDAPVVAKGLLQLEAATKWSAVADSWKSDRAAWVSRMQKLAGASP